ncbi:hypothetical protein HY624_03710 [Candidatus Uhrbacteria bacterium]|nr:hypothetical protein [Candidatus Uhrbacteria bacterium]
MKLLILFLTIAIFWGSSLTQQQSIRDCGEGSYHTPSHADECFVSSLQSCTPTKMTVKSGSDVYGLATSGSENGCDVQLSIIKGASEDLVDHEGKTVTCTQTNMQEFIEASHKKGQDALEFLNNLRLGIIASSIGDINTCTGSLKDYFNSL